MPKEFLALAISLALGTEGPVKWEGDYSPFGLLLGQISKNVAT